MKPLRRITESFYWRISAFFILLLSFLGTILILSAIFFGKKIADDAKQAFYWNLARDLAGKIEPLSRHSVDYRRFYEALFDFQNLYPDIDIYLLKSDGSIINNVPQRVQLKRQLVSLEPIHYFLSQLETRDIPLYGDDPSASNEQAIFSVAPMKIGTEQGYFYLILHGWNHQTLLGVLAESKGLRRLGLITVLGLISTIVLGLLIFFLITKRFRNLVQVVEHFEKGDLKPRVQVSSNDDISRLGRAVNKMADTIQANISALEKKDALRRELVANIVHDIRSPVAAIHGYAETLIEYDSAISKIEQRSYLEKLLDRGKVLSNMIGELFDLSKFEAKEITPEPILFDLNELRQSIIDNFNPSAVKRGVSLRQEGLIRPVVVRGDIQLIERALLNLTGNALNHTEEGGSVTLFLEQFGEKIKISIRDTGVGILPEDLAFIFERFYCAPTENAGGAAGTGLGLAIVKKIVEMHQSEIEVDSTPGKGTSFSFYLPLVSLP